MFWWSMIGHEAFEIGRFGNAHEGAGVEFGLIGNQDAVSCRMDCRMFDRHFLPVMIKWGAKFIQSGAADDGVIERKAA